MAYYARNTRGPQFSLLSPMNEPDWNGIEGPRVDQFQYGRLRQKLSQKLDAIGLSVIHFVGPDTASVGTGGNNYFPEMFANPTVMSKLDHFGLHNYAGYSDGAATAIKHSANPTKSFWITEVTNIGDILSHQGQGSAAILVWDAYDSYYNHGRGPDPGNGPALLAYDCTSGTYMPRKGLYECAQLFKVVSLGARRIGAKASDAELIVYTFYHPVSERITIVGRSIDSSDMTITGTLTNLPTVSSPEFYRTNASAALRRGTDVLVTNGSFSAIISPDSILTLTTFKAPHDIILPAAATGHTVTPLPLPSKPLKGCLYFECRVMQANRKWKRIGALCVEKRCLALECEIVQ